MAKIIVSETKNYDFHADKQISHPIVMKHNRSGNHFLYMGMSNGNPKYRHNSGSKNIDMSIDHNDPDFTPVHATSHVHQSELMKKCGSDNKGFYSL